MNMLYRFLSAGAAISALALLTFTSQADATARLVLKASSNLTIMVQDEENEEVQNLLDPESDNGVPGGASAATPLEPEQPRGQNAAPQGGNESEQNEIDQEEGK
jgi:hypothetical protein